MNAVDTWMVILGLALVTQLTRASFLLFGDRFPLPERVQHGLRYAPVCALIALVTPELFVVNGALELSLANAKLVAGVTATVIILATRSMIATIVLGMLVFSAFRWLA